MPTRPEPKPLRHSGLGLCPCHSLLTPLFCPTGSEIQAAQIETPDNLSDETTETRYGHQLWYLTLDDCVAIAIANQKHVSVTRADGLAKNHLNDTSGNPILLTSLDQERSLLDFECQVRNLLRDIDVSYWNLHATYQQASALSDQRDRASDIIRDANHQMERGTGTRQELAQAKHQFSQFETKLERALHGSSDPGENQLCSATTRIPH